MTTLKKYNLKFSNVVILADYEYSIMKLFEDLFGE